MRHLITALLCGALFGLVSPRAADASIYYALSVTMPGDGEINTGDTFDVAVYLYEDGVDATTSLLKQYSLFSAAFRLVTVGAATLSVGDYTDITPYSEFDDPILQFPYLASDLATLGLGGIAGLQEFRDTEGRDPELPSDGVVPEQVNLTTYRIELAILTLTAGPTPGIVELVVTDFDPTMDETSLWVDPTPGDGNPCDQILDDGDLGDSIPLEISIRGSGGGVIPEPASVLCWAGLFLGAALLRRRKQR